MSDPMGMLNIAAAGFVTGIVVFFVLIAIIIIWGQRK